MILDLFIYLFFWLFFFLFPEQCRGSHLPAWPRRAPHRRRGPYRLAQSSVLSHCNSTWCVVFFCLSGIFARTINIFYFNLPCQVLQKFVFQVAVAKLLPLIVISSANRPMSVFSNEVPLYLWDACTTGSIHTHHGACCARGLPDPWWCLFPARGQGVDRGLVEKHLHALYKNSVWCIFGYFSLRFCGRAKVSSARHGKCASRLLVQHKLIIITCVVVFLSKLDSIFFSLSRSSLSKAEAQRRWCWILPCAKASCDAGLHRSSRQSQCQYLVSVYSIYKNILYLNFKNWSWSSIVPRVWDKCTHCTVLFCVHSLPDFHSCVHRTKKQVGVTTAV